jgi:hypothetical protein
MSSPILNERYSIIVHQYIQNLESYTYYKTLKSLSTSSSLLSQVQPGFNYGNLKSNDDPDEKIVGYFEVSSISSKRIFFNFRDIFPTYMPFPPFYTECSITELTNCWDGICSGAYILALTKNPRPELVYYANSNNMETILYTTPACGDCTSISSNIRPSFWID